MIKLEKHVVIIFPHPDDESFGTAGSIIKFRQQNIPVTFLCGTLGEMGRNMGKQIFANRETLPMIRKQELAAVGKLLDMDIHLLGYQDKTLEFEDRQEVAEHIKEILNKIKPSLVITHYPGYAVHPDHDAIGAAAIEAVRLMDPEERPTVWAQAISTNYQEELGKPDVIHDVRDIFDQKMEAILTHKSQAEGMVKEINGHLQLAKEDKENLKRRLGLEQFYIWEYHD